MAFTLHKPQQYLFILGGLTVVLCTLGGINAAGGGMLGGGGAAAGGGGGGGGGARGSGMYNYGTYGSMGSSSSIGNSGLGMRRSTGMYGPIGLGNPHDTPRYLHPGQGGTSATQSPVSTKSGHHRLSAWGIITIVTFVILIGAGAYWGFICYPFFCKKERTYNMMMNMSSATTATPSTRSTEFEKLDHCCSKSTTSTRSNDTGISNI
uniref:Uncharacterized protein n=1 Tax=Anopheles farauti TaxID=69004 RepID=A0A182QSN6_9DIPT